VLTRRSVIHLITPGSWSLASHSASERKSFIEWRSAWKPEEIAYTQKLRSCRRWRWLMAQGKRLHHSRFAEAIWIAAQKTKVVT